MPVRTLTRRLLFSLLATVAFFGLIEGGLWGTGALVRAVVRVRLPVEDPAGAPTLLCLGDSVTFGLGAGTDQAYPARLAAVLPGLRVLNLGRPGYRTYQVADVLEGWIEHSGTRGPTRALLLSGFNDCAQLPGLLAGEARSARPSGCLLRRTRSYRLAVQILHRARYLVPPSSRRGPEGPPRADPVQDPVRCAASLADGLDRVTALCQAAGVDLTLLSYPVPALRASEAGRINTLIDALIAEEAAARGLPLVDLVPCMRAAEAGGSPGFYQADGIHLSAEGYAAMAACVREGLE
jgi:lysophospholipase L1-like esterase